MRTHLCFCNLNHSTKGMFTFGKRKWIPSSESMHYSLMFPNSRGEVWRDEKVLKVTQSFCGHFRDQNHIVHSLDLTNVMCKMIKSVFYRKVFPSSSSSSSSQRKGNSAVEIRREAWMGWMCRAGNVECNLPHLWHYGHAQVGDVPKGWTVR